MIRNVSSRTVESKCW